MKVRNRTAFKFAPLMGNVNYPAPSVSCVVKASFSLVPGGVAVPLEKQLEIEGDIQDKATQALLIEADLVPFKPVADVLLSGTCHVPAGKAITVCPVKFAVGGWSKELAVIGNRKWDKGLVFSKQGEPEPFTQCALHWGNAFGGPGFAENAVGKGFKDGALPNVEFPGKLIKGTGDKPAPAGFGPLPRTAKSRTSKVGTYDKKWLKERWPALPKDFDWTYFNAAPADQQVEGFLRGDEQIELTNLHPQHGNLQCRLPALRVRCFLRLRHEGNLEVQEVPMNLDTLHVDSDAGVIRLVWRGVQNTRQQELEDIEDFLIFSEPLNATPADRTTVMPWFEDPPQDVEAAPPPPVPGEGDTPVEAGEALANALENAGKELQGQMQKRVPTGYSMSGAPATFEGFGPMVVAMLALKSRLISTGQPVPPTLDKTIADFERDPALKQLESDMLIAQAMAFAKPAAALKGGALALSIKGGTSPTRDYSGQDLSGQDLSGADLSHTDFRKANLAGANLSGCKLEYANFSQAELSGANFSGCKGQRPDFTQVIAKGCNLEKAELPEAVFNVAELEGANLKEAQLAGGAFYQARCKDVKAQGASLPGADFTQAQLDGGDFTGANLAGATLFRALGSGVKLVAIKGKGLRAPEAKLPGLVADEAELPESVWELAELAGASFKFADLSGALFSSANLRDATLFGATVRRGFLRKADLSGLKAGNADFFQANFERANLKGASLLTSNLYEAAFYQALTDGADFTSANLKMTLLAK
ncbi:MAG: DUF2169 domain-containing protein [Planctomycetes bacterium]|nr:DUF2169 domain-containing protein [Planctomycetota bacterium]